MKPTFTLLAAAALSLALLPITQAEKANPAGGLAALVGSDLVDAEGNAVSIDKLEGKVVGLYFSAHWCPPCRKFTPKLVQYHGENKDNFEVVFVSSDRDAAAHKGYMKEANMPWYTIKYGSDTVKALKEKYKITGIPALVMLNSSGKTISRDGRTMVSKNISAKKLSSAKVETEEYDCGKCNKVHTREKVVYATDGVK